uniref:DNA repair protein XRCC4 n=1 Tax=Heliothis virescens TaxID=7102 RepID=A0A2A4J5H2_HELVI
MDHNAFKSTSITKFDIKGKTLYVKVLWKQNENDLFHIKIFDGDVTWSGRFSNEFAKKYRERFEETEEQYRKRVKKCLKGSIPSEFTYDFTISQEDNSSGAFTWKKRFQDSMHGLAVLVHGSVPVHQDASPESKDVLLDFLLEENKELRSTINSLQGKNEVIVTDLQKCKAELEKFVDIKTSLETSLYGKFVQLLNAKKRRIQVLEDSLHKFSEPNAGVAEQ